MKCKIIQSPKRVELTCLEKEIDIRILGFTVRTAKPATCTGGKYVNTHNIPEEPALGSKKQIRTFVFSSRNSVKICIFIFFYIFASFTK